MGPYNFLSMDYFVHLDGHQLHICHLKGLDGFLILDHAFYRRTLFIAFWSFQFRRYSPAASRLILWGVVPDIQVSTIFPFASVSRRVAPATVFWVALSVFRNSALVYPFSTVMVCPCSCSTRPFSSTVNS